MGIIIRSIISEKMTAIAESNQQRYVLLVTPTASRIEIHNAAEKVYNVKVDSVGTCCYDGKRSNHYTKSGIITGRKPAFKKVFITPRGENAIDFSNNT